MKLSEAIQLGSLLKPQAFGMDSDGRTCAIGAALEAAGVSFFAKYQTWPILLARVSCPASDWHCSNALACMIVHLNDHHRWTREHIADWVATIEPPDVIVAEPLVASITRGQ